LPIECTFAVKQKNLKVEFTHTLNDHKNAIMNRITKSALVAIFLLASTSAKSQILISLIFGETLNTPKIEFGLVGGWNQSNILTIPEAKALNNFNLGFYFHILVKNNSYISTGVLVKSNVGATGLKPYSVGDSTFDAIYENGVLTKKINCFYVPIQYHYRLHNRWYFEGGIQLGLRNKTNDIFNVDGYGGQLEYKTNAQDQYTRIDAGLIGGLGYKLKKVQKSTSIGLSYYYGLVDMSTVEGVAIKNTSFNVYVKIPIGTGEKKSEPNKQ
jgi:hypothetical protein